VVWILHDEEKDEDAILAVKAPAGKPPVRRASAKPSRARKAR